MLLLDLPLTLGLKAFSVKMKALLEIQERGIYSRRV